MKRIFCSIIILQLICGFANDLTGQSAIDISGEWKGVSKITLAQDLLLEYHFEQKGLTVEGILIHKTLNGKDSSKVKFAGSILSGVVSIRMNQIVYKTFPTCLSLHELHFKQIDGQEILVGKWKGDWGLDTCPPGTSGSIEIARTENAPLASIRNVEVELVDKEDMEGNALLSELINRKYYALIIGIDDYADDAIQDLDNPVADAKELQQVLQTHYTFDKELVIFLTNPSRTRIIEAFDMLSEKITERDHLLIFYAGHGIWDERLNQGFWLPADAKLNSKAQWLSNSTIRDYIGGIPSKHTLLITDACFSGGIFKERAVNFDNSKAILEMYKLPSRKAMTSGALKTVPDKSVFITYLNKNLINNNQPLLSAEDLFRRFKIAVINNSSNGQVPQYGAIGQVGDEGGDFIFLKRQ